MAALSEQELRHYASQIILPEIGHEGQQKLKDSKVLVIGAGGLGTPLLQYLTAAGIGTLGIADDGIIDINNLQRQVFYSEKDLGKMKTVIARQRLQEQNHMTAFEVYNIRITEQNILRIIAPYDLIVDATDNYNSRYLIDDASFATNKTWIFGSVNKFEGWISVFGYRNGPTLRCLFPEPPADHINNLTENKGLPGIINGLTSGYQTVEVLKILLDIGDVLTGKLLKINILNNTFTLEAISRNNKINQNRLFSDRES